MLTASLTLCLALGQESTLEKLKREISAVAERVRHSVVRVTAVSPAEELNFSGVVYSKDGHIVTDASGIDQAVEIRVTAGGRTWVARRMDTDCRTGVAVIKIGAQDLKPATLAPAPCKPGSAAIVVGGLFGFSDGSVGGTGSSILVRGRKHENMVQVIADLQPGDCGGFVADLGGRLMGLVHSTSTTESVGFATSAAWVRFSADLIIKHGRMVRGWLGAGLRPLDETTRAQSGLEAGEGAEVTRVEFESPARRAGLNLRDVLVAYDGQPVRDLEALQWKVAQVETATKVKLVFLRNRARTEVEAQIEIDPQK